MCNVVDQSQKQNMTFEDMLLLLEYTFEFERDDTLFTVEYDSDYDAIRITKTELCNGELTDDTKITYMSDVNEVRAWMEHYASISEWTVKAKIC